MEKDYDILFKLIIVGDTLVGKSSLLSKYVDELFLKSIEPTIGVDFKVKTIKVKEKYIKLQIWDTAGREKFHNIITRYFRGSSGILLLYDITNKESFKNISKWIKLNENSTSNENIKVLVGNKCDLDDNRVVSEEEGKKLADDYDMIFFEASAKTGKNINEIFYSLVTKIVNSENEKSQITNKTKDLFNRNLITNEKKEKEVLPDDNYNKNNKEIDKLNNLLKEEKLKNENLSKKNEILEKELKKEKDENKLIKEKLKQLDLELSKKIKELDIEKNKNHENFNNLNNINIIKDKEINELKEKLSRYPFELNEGEKMMTINFISDNQKISNFSLICKNTDIFNNIEKRLYEEFQEFYGSENYFTIHGNKINKFKSLDENNIKNNDVIILNKINK